MTDEGPIPCPHCQGELNVFERTHIIETTNKRISLRWESACKQCDARVIWHSPYREEFWVKPNEDEDPGRQIDMFV